MSRTTITDIAYRLNVTPSTVSRALSGNPRVKESTRLMIEKTAKEMGYERNLMAANLRKGVADIVGIIVPRINRRFFGSVISGAESILKEAGYTVIICQTHERKEDEIQALRTMVHNQVAGLLISHSIESSDGNHIIDVIGSHGIKLIQFDRVLSELPGAKIVNDNFNGAYIATCHLIENGYKKIGHLAGYMTTEHYRERICGYKKALSDHGYKVDEQLIFYDSILRETGYESAKKAISMGCDAIYSAGDFSALGALEAARDSGLSVPDKFGVVGTANEFFTGIMSPGLSSLEMSPKELGRRAAYAFLNNSNEKEIVKMELIKRESSIRKI